jgi:hypothetical protein
VKFAAANLPHITHLAATLAADLHYLQLQT